MYVFCLRRSPLLRAVLFIGFLIVSKIAFAAPTVCDLSSDEPSLCLVNKLRTASDSHQKKVNALKKLVNERIADDPLGTRFTDSVSASENAWKQASQANCKVLEAAHYDGSARLNAVSACELEELDARNYRLDSLIMEFGGDMQPRQRKAK